jgi:ABC-2 type transport system permease protein
MMSPLAAKLMPEILSSVMPEGMNITIAEPTAMDSWAQFFKNVTQMGLIVSVIVLSGIMANELSKGTLINLLTKGLSRKTVILSKVSVAVLIWTAVYALCFAVTYAYTAYFWKDAVVNGLFFSAFCLWFFGVLLIAAIFLGSVLSKSSYGCLLFVGFFVAVLMILNIAPKIQEYNPIALSSGMQLLSGQLAVSDFTAPIVISALLIFVFIVSSILIFDKKQI